MNIVSGFADISVLQLLLVACVALFAAVVGGLAGYGTGALMPLVLVPLIGAEPVVPIIAISSIFTNLSRFAAYLRYADRRRAGIVILAAALTTALGVAVTEDAKRIAQRLRLTNAETKTLDSIGHRWWRLAGMDEATARRRLYRLGEDAYRNRLLLAWARAGGADTPDWRQSATLPQRWSAPKFPLKAADFVSRGIAEGPALGHVLTLAEDAWLAADFPLDDAALKAIADQTVSRFTRDHRL